MGCNIKKIDIFNLNKIKSTYKKSFRINFSFILIFTIIFSFFFFSSTILFASGYTGFIPNPPTGNTTTDVSIENEYVIATADNGSYWKFDWGDGTSTDWIEVKEGQKYVMQSHSWSSYGNYNLKIKHKSIYSVESAWSNPLIVTVFALTDNNSIDEDYQDNLDDDYDGLNNSIEQSIGTSPKNPNDVVFIIIKSTTYFLISTNNDSNFNFLYNPLNGVKTSVEKKEGYYFLDINNDKNWDYKYLNGYYVFIAPFEIPWLYIVIGVIIGIIILFLILFKKGLLFFYQEEVIIEEK